MMLDDELTSLTPKLRQLSSSEHVNGRQKQAALRLAERLEAPIAMAVVGPSPEANGLVFESLRGLIASSDLNITLRELGDISESTQLRDVDIAIWCSFAFAQAEAAVWEAVPDSLKDHSYLVILTGDADQNPSMAVSSAFDLFDDVVTVPISNSMGALARLADTVQSRVRAGRQADQDSAELLIGSCPDEAVLPVVAVPVATINSESQPPSVLVQIDEMMGVHARNLATLAADDELVERVLINSEMLCQELSDVLEGHLGSPEVANLNDDIFEAHDSIVLMTLEGGLGAATDAVKTLIQLRKDVQLQLAA